MFDEPIVTGIKIGVKLCNSRKADLKICSLGGKMFVKLTHCARGIKPPFMTRKQALGVATFIALAGAEDDVRIVTKEAAAEVQAGATDVVLIEPLRLATTGWPGPWKVRIRCRWSRRNPQMLRLASLEDPKKAAKALAYKIWKKYYAGKGVSVEEIEIYLVEDDAQHAVAEVL
ncbi:MAG: hypothetical protein UW86_C0016G0005 [Microgenomates group bacterium GW2011_GWA1_Microgenomates_45_10]|nr:MAG: hypothetical protein UW86_C0016G0005 [Microgenomates group bacterium GW2011_GWA1_Microgenomates_45_10]